MPTNLIDNIVSMERIKWAVHSFLPFKSAGPDGIIPMMLQNSSDYCLSILRSIFISCLQGGFVPSGWKEVKVIFIPKAGKASHSKPKDFRPISLSSFLLKTLERLIDLYLRSSLETRFLSNAQHAYLKGKSVESALHDAVSFIEKGLDFKDYTLAAFLDIEGAFNNITIEAIKEALTDAGVQDFLIDWITTMLNSRVINSGLGDCSTRKEVTRGTPQGGVLSPLLWLLAVNVILRRFDQLGRKIIAYADDVVLLVSGKFLDTISGIMESALADLSSWASSKGLGINPDKTELVLFTRKYKVDDFRLPTLNGKQLRLSNEAKFLGIILDRKLTWKSNTLERMKKGLNAYYFCRNSIGKSWGLRPIVVYWIYTTIVRPVLTYGCAVWWEAADKISFLALLNKVQRCACTGITGAQKSTPQAALDVMLNLAPLDKIVKGIAARSLLRLYESGILKYRRTGHTVILKLTNISHLESGSSVTDYQVKEVSFNSEPEVVIPERTRWEGRQSLFPGNSIFTDGSKMDIGTGAGVFFKDLNIRKSFRLADECSVFQAEIFAIWKAVELIPINLRENSVVTIYVDSQAALKAMKGHNIMSKLVHKCRSAIMEVVDKFTIRLCWVPGHCDIEGNEIADEAARQGSSQDLLFVETGLAPPICHFYRNIKSWIDMESAKEWQSLTTCRISRALWPGIDPSGTKLLLSLSKNKLRKCIGILTGHCAINSRLNRWDSATQDICRLCADEESSETVEHILCHCPMLQSRRLRYLDSRFHMELEDIQKCKLSGVISFIVELSCLR